MPLSVFSGLVSAVANVIDYAVQEFVKKECAADLINIIKDKLYPESQESLLQVALKGCSIKPENFPAVILPDGYGEVEPLVCEAEVVCDVLAVKTCMESLAFDNVCG